MPTIVTLSKQAKKDIQKMPKHVVRKLRGWVDAVMHEGIRAVRKVPGFHDEPLKGSRVGQRSIRLSRQYRAIYTEKEKGEYEFLKVVEVNAHEY